MADKKEMGKGIPAALLIPGKVDEEDDGHDVEAPDDYDTAAHDEAIRAVHARDPEAHADAMHEIIKGVLRKHGLLKEAEGEPDSSEETLGEEPGG